MVISSVSCSCFLILVWPFPYTLMWLLPWRCWYGCVLVPWEIDFKPTGWNTPCNTQKTVSSILCRVGTRQEYYDMHCMLMSCTVVLFEAMTADWKTRCSLHNFVCTHDYITVPIKMLFSSRHAKLNKVSDYGVCAYLTKIISEKSWIHFFMLIVQQCYGPLDSSESTSELLYKQFE